MPNPLIPPKTGEAAPELSMVVPAYRQRATIEADVARLHAVLNQLTAGSFELIVVVDGFVDDTLERATALALPKTTVTGYATNVDKGHAVRYGMQRASGTYVGFIDAGMDIDPSAIGPALAAVRHGAVAATGSKLHPDSRTTYL